MKMTASIKKPNFGLMDFSAQIARISLLQQARTADFNRWKNDQLKPKIKPKKVRTAGVKKSESVIKTIAKSRISNEAALTILKNQLKLVTEGK